MSEVREFINDVKASFKRAWVNVLEWYFLPFTSVQKAARTKPQNLGFIKSTKYLFVSVFRTYKDWILK